MKIKKPNFDDTQTELPSEHCYSGCFLFFPRRRCLVQLRDVSPGTIHPGKMTTFGGRLENGETPRSGLVRELKEELDLEIDPDALIFVGSKKIYRTDATVTAFFFLHRIAVIPSVCNEGKMVSISYLGALLTPKMKWYIKYFFGKSLIINLTQYRNARRA